MPRNFLPSHSTIMALLCRTDSDIPIPSFLPLNEDDEIILRHKNSTLSFASTTTTITGTYTPKCDILGHRRRHNPEYRDSEAGRSSHLLRPLKGPLSSNGVDITDIPHNPFIIRITYLGSSPLPLPSLADDSFWTFPEFPANYAPSLLLSTDERTLLEFTRSEHHAIAYTLRFHDNVFNQDQPQSYAIRQRLTFDGRSSLSSLYELMRLVSTDSDRVYGIVLAVSMKDEGGHYPISSQHYPPIQIYIPLALLGPTLLHTYHGYANQQPFYYITPTLKFDSSHFDDHSSIMSNLPKRNNTFAPISYLYKFIQNLCC